MTVVTLLAAAPVMGVILSMASITGRRRILKRLDLMTIQAGDFLVASD
jgi:hypothetical protein